MLDRRWLLVAFLAMSTGPSVQAQPTFKLSVKPDLAPHATLTLDGTRITRTPINDDPGFRIQYHFMKDGKTIAAVEARGNLAIDLPHKEPGMYVVFLELFYPAYKGGNVQKGGFKSISNVVTIYAYKAPDGDVRLLDIGTLRATLFYGLSAGSLIPVPELPPAAKP